MSIWSSLKSTLSRIWMLSRSGGLGFSESEEPLFEGVDWDSDSSVGAGTGTTTGMGTVTFWILNTVGG